MVGMRGFELPITVSRSKGLLTLVYDYFPIDVPPENLAELGWDLARSFEDFVVLTGF